MCRRLVPLIPSLALLAAFLLASASARSQEREPEPEPSPTQPEPKVPEPEPKVPEPKEPEEPEIDTIEVTVDRRAPTKLSFRLTNSEVRTLPGAFGDAFRAVGTLPGLTPIISGFPYFYVRGAPPGNVGYRYDGIAVPTLFHVGIGPSILHPAFVDSVELHPGAYAANLGQYSGGFVTADATPPAFQFRAEAQVRLFDTGAYVEAPFADGKGSVSVGGRYSYTAAILSLVVSDAVLDYRDFQARVTYELSSNDRITVFGMGSYDLLGSDKNDVLEVGYGVEFYRLSVIHQHDFADGLWRTQVTGGYDRAVFGFDSATRANSINARTRYEKALHPAFSLRAGAEANLRSNDTVDPKYVDPDQVGADFFQTTFPSRTDSSAGVWVDSTWDPTADLRITPGVRLDYYHSQGTEVLSLEPRLRADYSLTPTAGLIAAFGVARQPPSFVIPLGGVAPADLQAGLQRTVATSVGAKLIPWSGAQASATVFYNRFSNMTDALGASETGGGPDTDLTERSQGSAIGLEGNFTGKLSDSLTGLLSYTLSRSTREVGGRDVYSQFDRTHVLNTALRYDFGRGYSLGARYLAYTGIPFGDDDGNASLDESPDRARFFQRVDARFEKRWTLGTTAWMALVVEGLNVTGSSEETAPGVDGLTIAIPSIGLEGGF